MKLSEFLNGGGLFREVNAIKPFPFLLDSTFVDMLLVTYNGDKTVFKPVMNWDLETTAKTLVMHFGVKWDLYITQEDMLSNVNTRQEVTETINTTELRNNTRDDVNKISAFNETILIDNDGSNSVALDELDGQVTRTSVNENIDVEHAYNTLNLTSKNSIIQKVLNDVSGFLTLSIY